LRNKPFPQTEPVAPNRDLPRFPPPAPYPKTSCNADSSIMGWQASFGFSRAAKSWDESLTSAVQIAFYPPILS